MQVKRIGSLEKANSAKNKIKKIIIKTIKLYSQAIVISRKSLGGKTTKVQPAAEVRTARGQKHLDKREVGQGTGRPQSGRSCKLKSSGNKQVYRLGGPAVGWKGDPVGKSTDDPRQTGSQRFN